MSGTEREVHFGFVAVAEVLQQALSHVYREGDEPEPPALDPEDMRGHVIMTSDGEILIDGSHRIVGVSRWAELHEADASQIELPAIFVSVEKFESEHPEDFTPDWLIEQWTEEAAQ